MVTAKAVVIVYSFLSIRCYHSKDMFNFYPTINCMKTNCHLNFVEPDFHSRISFVAHDILPKENVQKQFSAFQNPLTIALD